MPYLIYVLHCTGDTLYTGITPDLRRRMRQHCGQLAGGAKYTGVTRRRNCCKCGAQKPALLLHDLNTLSSSCPAARSCCFWNHRSSGRPFCRNWQRKPTCPQSICLCKAICPDHERNDFFRRYCSSSGRKPLLANA